MKRALSRQDQLIRETATELRTSGKCGEHGLSAGWRDVRDDAGRPVLDDQGKPKQEPRCRPCRILGGYEQVGPVQHDPDEARRMRPGDRAQQFGSVEQRQARAERMKPIRARALPTQPGPGELYGADLLRGVTRQQITDRPKHRPTGRGGLWVVDGGRAPGGDR